MVAACYGDRTTLRELRSRFRVSLRGMTLKRLRDCAEALGLRSRAARLDLDELAQLRLPAILHWDLNHFVVLESVRARKARIVDPAVGTRVLGLDEIGASFTGVALELAPTPDFQPRRTESAIGLSSFASSLRGLAGPLATVFGLTVVLQVFALVMPLNTQLTVDQGIRQGDMNLVFALAAGFALIGVVGALTGFFRSLLLLYVGNTSAFRMVAGLAHHLIRLPDTWFDARHTGDVLSRFGSLTPIRQFLTTGAFAMLLDATMAVGTLAVMFVYLHGSTPPAMGNCRYFLARQRLGMLPRLKAPGTSPSSYAPSLSSSDARAHVCLPNDANAGMVLADKMVWPIFGTRGGGHK